MIPVKKGTKFYCFDIETLGLTNDSVVVAAAFLVFDFNTPKTFKEYVDDALYIKFKIKEQKELGRFIDPETLDWWKRQTDDVRIALMPTADDVSIQEGCDKVLEYLAERGISKANDKTTIKLCRGQDFDIPIFNNLLAHVNAQLPGAYWNSRDIRSFISGALLDFTMTTIYSNDREYKTIEGFQIHDARHDVAKAVVELQNVVRLAMGEIELTDL